MKTKTFSLSAFALTLGFTLSFPLLSSTGAPDKVSDDFSAGELSEKWKAAKGAWTVENGKLKGAELASDKHAAVVSCLAPHTDSKVSVSFELAGSKGFHLSYNHPKGHLFRVIVSESGVSVRTDKDKKDPASKSELLDRKPIQIEQGKAYTLTCETKGQTVAVTLGGVELKGSHASLAREKTGYRLVVKGEGVLFDDFAVLN